MQRIRTKSLNIQKKLITEHMYDIREVKEKQKFPGKDRAILKINEKMPKTVIKNVHARKEKCSLL